MSEESKPHVVKSHDIRLDSDYVSWVHDVKQRYVSAQIKSAVKVNTEQLFFNWQLGRDLVERKAEEKWGKGIVEQLSLDMKGLKLQQVGVELDRNEKLQQLVAEIGFPKFFGFVPWGHHIEIVTKCKMIEEAMFYVRKTIEESWSRSVLIDNIKAHLYQSSGNALTNFAEKLPTIQGKLNFYVNAVNELMKTDDDNPTIGLLICKDKDQTEVQWAFQGIETPMGVATYDNIRMNEIKSQLPSEEAIQKRLEQAEEEYLLKLQEKNK